MIGASIFILLLALDGSIGRFDGILLFAGIILYTLFAIKQGRKESKAVAMDMPKNSARAGRDSLTLGRCKWDSSPSASLCWWSAPYGLSAARC
jgi:Ca2+/Na+ antiporter